MLIALLIGHSDLIGYKFSLSRVAVFFPFFLWGYYTDKRFIFSLISRRGKIISALVFLLSFAAVLCMPSFSMRWLYGCYSYNKIGVAEWYSSLIRLFFIVWGAILTLCLFILMPVKKTAYSKMGQRTLSVYILHGFIMLLLEFFGVPARIVSPLNKLLFLCAVLAGSLLLLSRPLGALIRAKKTK